MAEPKPQQTIRPTPLSDLLILAIARRSRTSASKYYVQARFARPRYRVLRRCYATRRCCNVACQGVNPTRGELFRADHWIRSRELKLGKDLKNANPLGDPH